MTRINCPSRHYANNQECRLPKGHREIWHQTTHPTRGTLLRFRQALGTRWTQEWEADPQEGPDAGEWFTLHYATGPVDTVLVEDLDDRMRGLISSHTALGQIRRGGTGLYGIEELCACGTWFDSGSMLSHNTHVGHEVAVVVRSFFDMGREQGLREASDVLRAKRCGETPPGFAAAASAVERHAADRE